MWSTATVPLSKALNLYCFRLHKYLAVKIEAV
uniref:Uncharacterized protein n=1 Tax=Anguilla anguilla TaxID=7936 RepID=A0A0E9RZZ5_ANGAN